jgi:hypothetical protein
LVQQGRTVKEVLRIQVRDFGRLDTYGRYLAEKGLRAALARRMRDATAKEHSAQSGVLPQATAQLRNP